MTDAPRHEIETPDRVAVSIELAGLGARALAWIADALLIFLAWMAAVFVYTVWGDLLREWQALSAAAQIAAVLGVVLSGWGWDVAWEAFGGGRTPGKRLLGLRVIRIDGEPVGIADALARNALRIVELPLGYAPAILAVALGSRRQRLGDLVAGTLVVRDRRYDLGRYGAPTGSGGRWALARGAAGAALSASEFERLTDFLRRRRELAPDSRVRLAARIAAPLARRAGVAPPAAGEAEPFLEALAAAFAEGR